ncbi:TraR/DksA family transcriptional regulator [Streptomyces fumanus]|uniref:TraR/DksA family transcriptional regulator n=1 Tax=Streptomyces fumanus TaxID=67302 RepID=UPI0033C3C265
MVHHQTIGETATHLSPEDLTALRECLREQRLFRREQLRRIAAEPGAEDARRCRTPARDAVRARLAASARMVLADVEAALRRIAEGGYGVCGRCRRPLDRELLLIVPQTRYCPPCRRIRETGR